MCAAQIRPQTGQVKSELTDCPIDSVRRTFQLLSVSFELCLTKSVGVKVVDSIMDANSPCGSVCGLLFPVCYTDVAVVEGALSL